MTDEELADLVTGYANGLERAVQETGMDQEALEDKLLDLSVEKCPTCDWYVDSHELFDDEGDLDGHCCNCRED